VSASGPCLSKVVAKLSPHRRSTTYSDTHRWGLASFDNIIASKPDRRGVMSHAFGLSGEINPCSHRKDRRGRADRDRSAPRKRQSELQNSLRGPGAVWTDADLDSGD